MAKLAYMIAKQSSPIVPQIIQPRAEGIAHSVDSPENIFP